MHKLALNMGDVDARMRLLSDAYARRTPTVSVVSFNVPFETHSYRDRFNDLDLMLEHSVRYAQALADSDNDMPPFIDTFCTVVMVAEAFGCPIRMQEADVPWAFPAVESVGGVWNTVPCKVKGASHIRRMFEWVDYAQSRLGTDLPFWSLDIQSPFSVAAQIVDPTDLLAACMDNPKAVHHLCRMVTDFTIEMMHDHLAQMDHPGFPGRNFPSISENIGICIADDTPAIMLGPRLYEEFALPYNSEIGKQFGGVHIHSCGNYAHNLSGMLQITNIRSIQFHAGPGEFDLPASIEEQHPVNMARERVTLYIDTNEVSRGDDYADRPREFYAEYLIPRLHRNDGLSLILDGCPHPDGADAGIRWTRQALEATGGHSV